MKVIKEAEVDLKKYSFLITSEAMTEIVIVGLDQDQRLVLIEIGLDVISTGSIIILQMTV